jgi:hypothetical protein
MKHIIKRFATSFLTIVLLSAFAGFAAGAAYSGIAGHGAEQTLTEAVNDGLLEGGGSDLEPDGPITGAELVSILTRVFSAETEADLTGTAGICADDWYYDAAAKAVAMGIIAPENGRLDLDEPISRLDAFLCLSEAFQLVPSGQDSSVLYVYEDEYLLPGEDRPAIAALAAGGYIEGYGGSLHIGEHMTRAEFVTVLYKIASDYTSAAGLSGDASGTVVSGDAVIEGVNTDGSLFFDCSSADIVLRNVSAPTVVIRSGHLESLTLFSSNIDRLVFAAGSGDLNFSPTAGNTVGTAAVGTEAEKITLGGRISNIEITGDNRDIVVSTSITGLTISGSGNRILINPGVSVGSIQTLAGAAGNTVTVNGYCGQCELYGPNTSVDGSGTVAVLLDNAAGSVISVTAWEATVNENYGLNGVSITITAPDTLASYERLEASVSIEAPGKDLLCQGRWYLADVMISSEEIDLGSRNTAALSFDAIDFRADIPVTATLSFVLSCNTPEGIYQQLRADRTLTLENRNKYSAQEVLSLVTTGYKGDYTLAWAQDNDFDSILKEEWVNAKGYSSKTEYLVWVSIAYQRVNVFTGSAGNWNLEKTFIVGTGAPGHSTPTGVFTIIGKRSAGWTTSTYTVKPLINFLTTSYAFHSRLYYPGTTTVRDERIGFPVSHGCIRMYDEDVAYMFDYVPVDTTVVIY